MAARPTVTCEGVAGLGASSSQAENGTETLGKPRIATAMDINMKSWTKVTFLAAVMSI